MQAGDVIMGIRSITIHACLIASLFGAARVMADDATRPYWILPRCGAYVPLDEMDERVEMWVPYLALAFRAMPPAEWSRYLALEIEAGFFAHRARGDASVLPSFFKGYRFVKPPRAVLYAEPVMASALGEFFVWKGLYLMPGFGAGMTFIQVRGGSSPGSYNHVSCAAGLEVGYRISDLLSAAIRVRAVIGFDRNRVLYHVVPDAGILFHL